MWQTGGGLLCNTCSLTTDHRVLFECYFFVLPLCPLFCPTVFFFLLCRCSERVVCTPPRATHRRLRNCQTNQSRRIRVRSFVGVVRTHRAVSLTLSRCVPCVGCGCSVVYLARKVSTGDLFAMKVQKKADIIRKGVGTTLSLLLPLSSLLPVPSSLD